MAYFTGLGPYDHEAHFEALRRLAQDQHGVPLPAANEARTAVLARSREVFAADLGAEVHAFLAFLADITAAGAFETLLGARGKISARAQCPYLFNLRDLSEIDPTQQGLSFFELRRGGTYFSVLSEDQANSPCPCYAMERRGKVLSRGAFHTPSLICQGLQFFGRGCPAQGKALSTGLLDEARFHTEAERMFGPPVDLGGGVYIYECDSAEILVTPVADLEIKLTLFDHDDLSAFTPALAATIEAGTFVRDKLLAKK